MLVVNGNEPPRKDVTEETVVLERCIGARHSMQIEIGSGEPT